MENIKKLGKILAIGVIAFIIAGAATEVVYNNNNNTDTISRNTGRSESQIYRDIFMSECATSPALDGYCGCTYAGVIQDYTPEQLDSVVANMNQAEVLEFIQEYAEPCFYMLDQDIR